MRAPVAVTTALLAAGGLALLLLRPSSEQEPGPPDASPPRPPVAAAAPAAPGRPASPGTPEAPARADAGAPDAASPVMASLPPEQAVEMLVHSHHGVSELAGAEMRGLWEEVRRNPQPYLPHLRARVSLEQLEAAPDAKAFQDILSAASYLLVLGGEDERQYVGALLQELHREQNAASAGIAEASRGRNITAMPEDEQASFRKLVGRKNRLLNAEGFLLRAFAAVKDARLRDTVLARLDSTELQERYIDYLAATARHDPVVRARLQKMLEAPASPVTEQHLRRFFDGPRE